MKSGAHHFTINRNVHAEAIAQLVGARWQCPHVHVSGRRCGVRVVARLLYCDDHQRCGEHPCAECHAMMDAFGVAHG